MILLLFPDNIALNESALLIGAFAFILVVIGLPMVLKKKGVITGHAARKIVHLFAGFSCFIVPFLNYPWLALILSGLFLVVTRISTPKTQVFQMMGEKNEKEAGYLEGPFSYALSINILVFVFAFMPNFFFFPAASIMIMMISDTAASFFGRRYGKHKYTLGYTKTTRSLEGSIAMFVTALGLGLLAFAFFGNWFPNNHHTMTIEWIFLLAVLVAAVSTVVEIFSPSNVDDLLVPIAGCFISFFLTLAVFPASIVILA